MKWYKGVYGYTIQFDTITPMWGYSSGPRSDYPSGCVFQGTCTVSNDSTWVKGDKSWHTFYLSKDNTSMLYDDDYVDYAVFVKQ
ncbi:hypothetical protein AGMMS49940_16870 [Spirochaetia bacterium]|nr:hypothetical protein AGMMS49940_16870 [Spirochaetia bacterium]